MVRAAFLLPVLLPVCLSQAMAQEIEGLIVEVYHVTPASMDRGPTAPPIPAGTVTYRIFLDLPPGHQVQAIYGDKDHPLVLGTTGRFYNEPLFGKETGDEIRSEQLQEGAVPLDSWLTVAAATNDHFAVLKRNDPDGSELPGYRMMGRRKDLKDAEGTRIRLSKSDGLVKADTLLDVVQFNLDLLPFSFNAAGAGLSNDSLLHTRNGGWAVLGGTAGLPPENHVLIAQLTTDGELYFSLNVQVEAPDGSTARWVWNDPRPGEVLAPMLVQGPVPEELLHAKATR